MTAQEHIPLLVMEGITKTYPNGTVANRGVDFTVYPGEIHALVGENGAGKSTLMKVLYGMETPDEGSITLEQRRVTIESPRTAIGLGIGMVHQHFMLVPSMTVAENVVLGSEPRRGAVIDRAEAVKICARLSEQYGLPVDPRARIRDISVGMRQRVEILKALYRGARILILDEPTAVLTPQETDQLFTALRKFVARGLTIIFITHKLREVQEVSHRITVMRDARVAGVRETAHVDRAQISRLMVGRDVLLRVDKPPARPGAVTLEVEGISLAGPGGKQLLKDISFQVRAGEIFGIAGVEGNGQSELLDVLTGLRPPDSGTIKLEGRDVTRSDIRHRRKMGMAHIPEDRLARGVAGDASVAENLILDSFDEAPIRRGTGIDFREVDRFSRRLIETYDIRVSGPRVPVRALSGGNMQKVVIARELDRRPPLLVAAQPTRGVDIGAIEFIHGEIIRQRNEGAAVLLISAELSEVMALSDTVSVIFDGEITAVFDDPSKVSEEEIGLYMMGARHDETA